MKCALMIPAWRPEDIFPSKTSGSQINYWQPVGTLQVAAYLREAGHEVRFLNGAFRSHDDLMEELSEWRPQCVGLYSTAFGWPRARFSAEEIRKVLPETFLVAGGPYPIAAGASCLDDSPELDAIVTGEGEYTMAEILERLGSQGRDLSGVKGTIWRKGGIVEENEPRPLIEDLDALPFPARDLLGDSSRYIPAPATYRRKPVAVMITSRGCNRRCIFCFQIDKTRKSGIRYRSVENVLAEIEHLLNEGYREIKFIDDTFAADYDRAMAICREIKHRGLDFTWFASACVNQVDEPLLKAFREAGCWAILFGVESGVQKNLNAIRKGSTIAQIRTAVKAAKSAGLKVNTPFIFGIPGETYEEALRTIDFAIELDPDMANFHAITPFPGSELHDRLEELGSVSTELSDYTYQGAAFVPHSMTREEIIELRQIAFKRFYSRPSFLLKKLLELRSPTDLAIAAKSLKSLFWLWSRRGVFRRS